MGYPAITVSVFSKFALDQAGLEALLANLPGLQVVPLDPDSPPQVLLFDHGNIWSQLPELPSSTSLILLVHDGEISEIPLGSDQGVLGLFSKNETGEALSIAVRQVARGEAYLSPNLALALLQQKHSRASLPDVDLNTLTERERQVLALLAEGLSNKAIAARLYLSVRTVDGHLSKLYTRLGVRSRTEAMRFAIEHNLVRRVR